MPLLLTVFESSGNIDTLLDTAGFYSGSFSVALEPGRYMPMALGLVAMAGWAGRSKSVVRMPRRPAEGMT